MVAMQTYERPLFKMKFFPSERNFSSKKNLSYGMILLFKCKLGTIITLKR